ncbi:MAG: AbrB/MazE/SpoVT family DNA-binding domain-containing protein [Actinomycetia bacterium]|nr:AbrB/MazE/SpoVT family DNA-binding domain-containing protein [Actinomycetes bacterium]
MQTRVQKWGNSQGIRVSKDLLADADIQVGDEVEIVAREGSLVVVPRRRVRGGHNLTDLVKEIPSEYTSEELEWGPPAGKEVW